MNTLQGTIVDVHVSASIALFYVDVAGDIFSVLVLEGHTSPQKHKINDAVTLLFKETEVGIGKNLSGMISLRNRFKGTIIKIDQGSILTKVTMSYQSHKIESIISTPSAIQMNLKAQDDIEWLVKSNEVSLMQNI